VSERRRKRRTKKKKKKKINNESQESEIRRDERVHIFTVNDSNIIFELAPELCKRRLDGTLSVSY